MMSCQLLFYYLIFAVQCLLQKGGKLEVPLQYLGPRGYAERSGAIFKHSFGSFDWGYNSADE